MRREVIILVVLVLLLPPLHVMANSSTGKYHIYMFGSSKCPHCSAMDEFFKTHNYSYTFCDMAVSSKCAGLFARLIKITDTPPSIPTIVVLYNGSVNAIVVGEIENETFWNTLISKKVSNTSIPVYTPTENGIKLYSSIPSSRESDILAILTVVPVAVTTITNSSVNSSQTQIVQFIEYKPNPLLVKGVVFFLIGTLIYIPVAESGILQRKR